MIPPLCRMVARSFNKLCDIGHLQGSSGPLNIKMAGGKAVSVLILIKCQDKAFVQEVGKATFRRPVLDEAWSLYACRNEKGTPSLHSPIRTDIWEPKESLLTGQQCRRSLRPRHSTCQGIIGCGSDAGPPFSLSTQPKQNMSP